MRPRCAILDDYQNVALRMADWSAISRDVDLRVYNSPLGDLDQVAKALADDEIVCLMRERTPFPRALFEKLPKLKLLVTTGNRNASIDIDAAKDHGVIVCGTGGAGQPTAEITFALILNLARHVHYEDARLKAGEPWQTTLGTDLMGKTIGIIGLGRQGTRTAHLAKAFDMKVIAWSPNLTVERCKAAGVDYANREQLFRQSDFVSLHMVLRKTTRGMITAADLALMKPTAYFINTARGPLVDEAALLDVLQKKKIAGAGLDVFDIEPLPVDHPFRKLQNVVLSPHLGYVTAENYRVAYGETVQDVRAYLDGKPIRVITEQA